MFQCCTKGHGLVGKYWWWMDGMDDLGGLFQPWWFYNSMIILFVQFAYSSNRETEVYHSSENPTRLLTRAEIVLLLHWCFDHIFNQYSSIQPFKSSTSTSIQQKQNEKKKRQTKNHPVITVTRVSVVFGEQDLQMVFQSRWISSKGSNDFITEFCLEV